MAMSLLWNNRDHSASALGALSIYLREPCEQVRRVLNRHVRLQQRLDHQRQQLLSKSQLQRLQQSFSFPSQQAYSQLLASDSRSRILAAFHLGDYVFGMNALVASVPHRGVVRVLSQQAATANQWQNVRAAFGARTHGPEAELLTANTAPSQLSTFLRKRGSTLLLFCDLPVGNGELVKVRFLGRDAWFPRGAATLAVANRVPVLPVITFRQGRRNQIAVLPQLESVPKHHAGERSSHRVQQLTQALVNILQQFFLWSPEQWRFLQSLPLYFDPAAAAPAAGMQTGHNT